MSSRVLASPSSLLTYHRLKVFLFLNPAPTAARRAQTRGQWSVIDVYTQCLPRRCVRRSHMWLAACGGLRARSRSMRQGPHLIPPSFSCDSFYCTWLAPTDVRFWPLQPAHSWPWPGTWSQCQSSQFSTCERRNESEHPLFDLMSDIPHLSSVRVRRWSINWLN